MDVSTPTIEVAPEQVSSGDEGSFFLLFLMFLPTLAFLYLVPLLATLYNKTSGRKWISYWLGLLLLNLIIKPVLVFILGPNAGTFVFLTLGLALLYLVNDAKADLIVTVSNLVVDIVGQQYVMIKQRVVGLAKSYGLVE